MHPREKKLSLLNAVRNLWITSSYTENGLELQCLLSNAITDEHIADIIAPFLRLHPQIVSVNLSRQKIGFKGAKELAAIKSIRALDLSYNQITGTNSAIKKAGPQLEVCNLERNPTMVNLVYLGIIIRYKNLKPVLQIEPSIIKPKITDDDIREIIAPYLRAHPEVTHVNLSGQQICNKGAVELSQIESILSLDLSFNEIGDGGAIALGFSNTLRTLNLTGNPFLCGDKQKFKPHIPNQKPNFMTGICDVGEVFRNNRTLVSLVLGTLIKKEYELKMSIVPRPTFLNNVPYTLALLRSGTLAHHYAGRGCIPYPLEWKISDYYNTLTTPYMVSLNKVNEFQNSYKQFFLAEYKAAFSYFPSVLTACIDEYVGPIQIILPREKCAQEFLPEAKPASEPKPQVPIADSLKFRLFCNNKISTAVSNFEERLDREPDHTGNAISRSVSNAKL